MNLFPFLIFLLFCINNIQGQQAQFIFSKDTLKTTFSDTTTQISKTYIYKVPNQETNSLLDSLVSAKITLEVCVDSSGKVIEAHYLKNKSSTQDRLLIDEALRNARKWKFKQSPIDRQCGTITYDFKTENK